MASLHEKFVLRKTFDKLQIFRSLKCDRDGEIYWFLGLKLFMANSTKNNSDVLMKFSSGFSEKKSFVAIFYFIRKFVTGR